MLYSITGSSKGGQDYMSKEDMSRATSSSLKPENAVYPLRAVEV